MKPIRLMSGILTVGFWTLASRVLGVDVTRSGPAETTSQGR